MLIDWFTVGAQALNFVILVWLMKRFLYKPILKAIDEREKRIAGEIADADARKAEAKKESEEFRRRNDLFDKERAALFTQAGEEAKAEGARLLAEVRKSAEVLNEKRLETFRNDARNLNQTVVRQTQEKVFSIVRKALGDLATVGLEERVAEVFIRRLMEMDGKSKDVLSQAVKAGLSPAILRSAFDLPAEPRAAIQKAINETFSADIHLQFETAPHLVGGIELVASGQKVAWSIADYLASLETSVRDLANPHPKSGSEGNKPVSLTTTIAATDG